MTPDAVSSPPLDGALDVLRAAGEMTRLRILFALEGGELTVSELTQVLAQSQPRISRHLKLMQDAGLIRRRKEGAWAFFSLSDHGFARDLLHILARVDRSFPELERDRVRLLRAHAQRAEAAERYFQENAARWDELRKMHAPEVAVEAAAIELLAQPRKFTRLLDFGTGTGRMLVLFAGHYQQAVGYDVNQQMLALARAKLAESGITYAEVRQGDVLNLPEESAADAGICHQVLHYLADPQAALDEMARCLVPGAPLLLVDFAPHDVENLREEFAHRRLGFASKEIGRLAASAGMTLKEERHIPPQSSGALTVSLWLLRKG